MSFSVFRGNCFVWKLASFTKLQFYKWIFSMKNIVICITVLQNKDDYFMFYIVVSVV